MTILEFKNAKSRFDIAGDKTQFDLIVKDMIENGGKLAPSDHWNWNLGVDDNNFKAYTDEVFDKQYSHLVDMLDPWVGVTGMQPLSKQAVEKYEVFLRSIDHIELLPKDIFSHGNLNGWKETDLGSILDIGLLTSFFSIARQSRLAVCEVGGGYGRLAEVFLETHKEQLHYVMIDAVPGSLMYSYYYLKSQFPELNIGSFYAGDEYDNSYDCYILPAWRAEVLHDSSFDVCINIESMQEMQQLHVDFYLGLFDRLTILGGGIYLSNARDYVFKGVWNIPSHWETLYLNNTPRSWTADHPTHILRKSDGEYSLQQQAHESAFKQQVVSWNYAQLIADRDLTCGELTNEIDKMKADRDRTWAQQLKMFISRNFLKNA